MSLFILNLIINVYPSEFLSFQINPWQELKNVFLIKLGLKFVYFGFILYLHIVFYIVFRLTL